MAGATDRSARDPLGPIDFILNVLGTLTLLALLVGTLTSLFGSGSGLGIGDDPVCAEASPYVLEGPRQQQLVAYGAIGDNGRFDTTTTRFCAEEPTGKQQTFYLGIAWPPILFWLGLLVTARRLSRQGRRGGMFTNDFARSVALIGTYLLVGCLLVTAVTAAAKGMLIATLLPNAGTWIGFIDPDFSVSTLIAGFAMLTVSRVLHQAVAMRDDLDATI